MSTNILEEAAIKNDEEEKTSGVEDSASDLPPIPDDDNAEDAEETEPEQEDDSEPEPEPEDVEKEPEPEAEDAGEVPSIPTEVLLEAGRYGFTAEEIVSFGTESALRAAIKREAARSEKTDGNGKAAEQPGKPGKFEVKLWDEAEEKKLLDEGFDQSVVNNLKSRFTAAEKIISDLHGDLASKISAVEGILVERDRNEYIAWFDKSCDKLGKEWGKILGPAGSAQRSKLAETVARLAEPELRAGVPLSDSKRNQLFKQAVKVTFSKTNEDITRKGLIKKADSRAKIRRPGLDENREQLSAEAEIDAKAEERLREIQRTQQKKSSGFFGSLRNVLGKKG
jgi:hypothetical protein